MRGVLVDNLTWQRVSAAIHPEVLHVKLRHLYATWIGQTPLQRGGSRALRDLVSASSVVRTTIALQ